jgi:large subunit ribosomal protein L17
MKHRLQGKRLSRNHHQRKALFLGLVRSLFTHGSIKSTLSKIKAVVPLAEKIAHRASSGTLADRRFLYRYFQDRSWVNRIVDLIQKNFPDQKGNYTKVTPLFKRPGDQATVARLELVKPMNFKPPVKTTKKELKKQVKKEKKAKKTKSSAPKKALPKK